MTSTTSQLTRALHRQVTPARDAAQVAITDTFLNTTPEIPTNCHFVPRIWNRRISSVPGPLECQRRLGRRRMGDLNAIQFAPAPPPWAFSVPLDFSNWKWEPPNLTRTERVEEDGQPHNIATASSRTETESFGWLGKLLGSENTNDTLSAPTDVSQRECSWSLSDSESTRVSVPPRQLLLRQQADVFQEQLRTFETTAASLTAKKLESKTKAICKTFRQLLFLGEIPARDVLPITTQLRKALKSASADDRLSITVYAAILDAISTSKVFTPSVLKKDFWTDTLMRVSWLHITEDACNLFARVLSTMPESIRSSPIVPKTILRFCRSVFLSWNSSTDNINDRTTIAALKITFDNWLSSKELMVKQVQQIRQARIIAHILRQFAVEDRAALVAGANKVILTSSSTRRTSPGLRYNWFYVLAHLPGLDQEAFLEAVASVLGAFTKLQPMSGAEICSLQVARWKTLGGSWAQDLGHVLKSYRELRQRSPDDSTAITSLLMAVYRCGLRRHGHWCRREYIRYRSVYKFLAQLGHPGGLLASLEAWSLKERRTLPLILLQRLALVSDNHCVAVDLYQLYSRELRQPGWPYFNPIFFDRYVERIIHDTQMPTGMIWEVLGLYGWYAGNDRFRGMPISPIRSHHRERFQTKRELDKITLAQTKLVHKAAVAFGEASHLTARQIWRHTKLCAVFLGQRKAIAQPVITCLYRLVTKDLLEGRPGRTSRLLYFVRLISALEGKEAGWNIRLGFRRWREKLAEDGILVPNRSHETIPAVYDSKYIKKQRL
ncbi:hypothetical protein QBC35DRAFT_109838 [Podospora australis]|uniref:Uncharacterized protein n=1 Tax=Podospora australis TaxID=1536484 RepID=A0AAN6X428_9PEZI|nr:hypothetical protein QBC35DRAFT_109838 [Podospora australis]